MSEEKVRYNIEEKFPYYVHPEARDGQKYGMKHTSIAFEEGNYCVLLKAATGSGKTAIIVPAAATFPPKTENGKILLQKKEGEQRYEARL